MIERDFIGFVPIHVPVQCAPTEQVTIAIPGDVLADQVIALDELNPQVASRMIQPLTTWRRYDHERQRRMRVQLERILATRGLSGDVFEMVSKTLGHSEEG